jgi:hypothetical protein
VRLLLILSLCFCILASLNGNAFASDSEKYITSNWGQASQLLYKGIPTDWWAAYFLKEFDKVAPAPGSNWTSGFSKRDTKGGDITSWLVDAREKGWVVRALPNEALPGAIGIKMKDTTAMLCIVREVYQWGVVVSELKDGVPNTYRMTYAQMNDSVNGFTFRGYILPVRIDDYLTNRQSYDKKQADFLNSQYKGYKDSWWGTWMLREFDKYAPDPGVNWHGSMFDWILNAEKAGWRVSTNCPDAKIGAILVRGDRVKDQAWGGIIRQITNGNITYEDRTGLHTIAISELPDKNFIGYIFPERQ